MSESAVLDSHTAKTQSATSDPAASAWVSANAGSGKTYVLSRRVIRLLLAGTDPSRILCLTFTRAAAAEMAQRVFAELGRWTRLSDGELALAIAELGGAPADESVLARARQLFARALDTPGGLKIQTIHAFCERLLQQFPFEANVPGHFEVLDERAQGALAVEARRAVLARAAAEPEGDLGQALKTVLGLVSDFTHEASLAEFVAKRDTLRGWIAAAGSLDGALAELRTRLGVTESSDRLQRRFVDDAAISRQQARELVEVLSSGSANDREAGQRLAAFVNTSDPDLAAIAYLGFYLTEGGDFRVNVVTRRTLQSQPGLDELLAAEAERLRALLDRARAAELYESTVAMTRLAHDTIDEYERRKRQRGFLDFEDLVVASVRLLSQSDAARWVQYKLDRGIAHVLIDEAQDTSPRQWQVIRALVDDFFAGEGATTTGRSVFAVGDEKQSIFSFQGAAPAWFARTQRELSKRARAGGYPFEARELHLSYRSVPVILDAVDAAFAAPSAHAGLTSEARPPVHEASRRKQPGRVIVWPTIKPVKRAEPTDWATPLDHLGEASPEVQLARRIARTVRDWLDRRETLDAPGRDGQSVAIRPGRVLVLVRTRGALSDAINRHLKSVGVPIAGSDRLALTEHITVRDLIALGRVVLTPEDDLSLAALLKSPLIGLDDDALFELAHGRGSQTLWQALADKAPVSRVFASAKELIEDWRALADLRDPHAFFARVLAGPNGRRAFLGRLGPEAADVLDEFVGETLRYEETNTPSLEGFLDWLQTSEAEIKRDTDAARDEVRVMTVHGAKGLEADVVFLVDSGMPPTVALHDPKLLPLDENDDPDHPGPLVWNRSIKTMPDAVRARLQQWRARSEEEYRRLLYVAMTRARDRLYVVGIDKRTPKDDDRRWHAIVRRGLDAECVETTDPFGDLSLEWRPEIRVSVVAAEPASRSDRAVPEWATRPVQPRPGALRLTPSGAVGDGVQAPAQPPPDGSGAAAARQRGRLVHRLLQSLPDLPAAARRLAGERYLAAVAHGAVDRDTPALLDRVLSLLDHPGFAEVFAAGSRAEVDITGTVETAQGTAVISGRIDRLAVTGGRVLIVDYKTNRPAPSSMAEVPPAYVTQLALYRLILRRLYPQRVVDAALLWTDLPALMAVPEAALEAAEMAVIAGGEFPLP